MTRDEARAIVKELWKDPKTEFSGQDFYINMLVRLGVLKLDEPATVKERLRKALNATSLKDSLPTVLACIDVAGLELVDK